MKLTVASSPHIRGNFRTNRIMLDVVIALLPAFCVGALRFGVPALLVALVSIATAVAVEWLYSVVTRTRNTIVDGSAVVTGLLLAMTLPATAPLWQFAVGAVFAIIVVKELYGGLGENFMNPALAGRCFLLICFAGRMTNVSVTSFAASGTSSASKGLYTFLNGAASVDGISSATPLAVVKGLEAGASVTENVSLFDMFFGFTGGVLGETSAFMILLGAARTVQSAVGM